MQILDWSSYDQVRGACLLGYKMYKARLLVGVLCGGRFQVQLGIALTYLA